MPKKGEDPSAGEAPRTDLPPAKEPYYEGYFGTDEEEGVEREQEDEGTDGADRRGSGGASGE